VLDESTILDTNPVDIYYRIINEQEAKTGEASKNSREITQEQALNQPEVHQRLQANIESLKVSRYVP